MAVATSSVNEVSRASESLGSGSSVEASRITPQRRPSTTIGAPTTELTFDSRRASLTAPEASP